MRTVETKVYTFEELSQDAQENALYQFWHHTEYPWQGEVKDTLDAFTDLFDFSVYHWEYDSIMASFRESFPEYYHELKNNVAREWFKRQSKIIYNDDCPLTGYYLDVDILHPIRTFVDVNLRTDSVADILSECVDNFFAAVVQDVEYYYSIESFAEHCAMNEYEFLENGDFYK